ncbi:hypothetical protein A2467_01465 [Candidatus Nomurabacteria bacterium RIFOXYC2_FULL_36_8]|nr:MAG: hypothetical protein UR97_C0003G0026 [Candidatus Nomurabacteria bacterium GW2011_GWE2_36_115]KKP94106.1 MAG: hypothetical protein US00_C0003G0030 [Candidatus Nomurabacteria bacterium GW2011_GWF2_36_126]KKP96766.1 MAG: hypothetical protein US04_C0001G0268 [Candidatus Nomurabacteria bacterium GW2011_GWD2_36_14]KKP99630.1 MAG: hypothetical protein US08_C0001G0313 [Candidatus Nomurabacteria bacterium GW2011_GWF2_36_19]KKQ05454.1 MAG: hypothetical protein US17_C0004G0026 [Candidatus Nomuraba
MSMRKISFKSKNIKIIVLILLCFASFVVFVSTFNQLYREGDLKVDYDFKTKQKHFPRTIDIKTVSAWMTFDYINVIFKIDPNYLKETLSINDPRYPNIRIGHYVKRNQLNEATFFSGLEQAISNYNNNK